MSTSWSALVEIGQILATSRWDKELHESLTELLRDVTNGNAIALTQLNPVNGKHQTLCNIGYKSSTLHHLNTWFVSNDEVYHYMRTEDNRPLRWRDMPFDYNKTYSASEVFKPAGFREGTSVCLYNKSGTYTGALHISSDKDDFASDDTMRLLESTQYMLGSIIDWSHSIGVCNDNSIRIALNNNEFKILRNDDNELLRAFEYYFNQVDLVDLKNIPSHSFLITNTFNAFVTSHFIEDILILDIKRKDLPYALTARELDVSSLLIKGQTNKQIAKELDISDKTISHHVCSIIKKLSCETRTKAAIIADRFHLHGLKL